MDTIGSSTDLPTWGTWVALGRRKLRADWVMLLDVAMVWSDRARGRRLLRRLDDRMLKDIGLSRADAWREARKPLWRA